MESDLDAARRKNQEAGEVISAGISFLGREDGSPHEVKAQSVDLNLIAAKHDATVSAYEVCIVNIQKSLNLETEKRVGFEREARKAQVTCETLKGKLTESVKSCFASQLKLSEESERRAKMFESITSMNKELCRVHRRLTVACRRLERSRMQAQMNNSATTGFQRAWISGDERSGVEELLEAELRECDQAGQHREDDETAIPGSRVTYAPEDISRATSERHFDDIQQILFNMQKFDFESRRTLREDMAASRRVLSAWKAEMRSKRDMPYDIFLNMILTERRRREAAEKRLMLERDCKKRLMWGVKLWVAAKGMCIHFAKTAVEALLLPLRCWPS